MLRREESRRYKPYSSLLFHLRKPIRVNDYGNQILQNGLFNKGTCFNIGERDRLGLRGLIPSKRLTMQQQIDRAKFQLSKEESDIRKYAYLRDLQDRNETLFHRILLDNIEELAPIVYTPTVGQACLEFGASFKRPRGMYFSHYVSQIRCYFLLLFARIVLSKVPVSTSKAMTHSRAMFQMHHPPSKLCSG